MKAKTCQQELGYLRGKVDSLMQQVDDLNQTVCELRQLVISLSSTSPNPPLELGISTIAALYPLSETHCPLPVEVQS